MSAFPKKPEPATAPVKSRPHPIALPRRRMNRDGLRERQARGSDESIGDHERLDFELASVGDMSVQATAACPVYEYVAPVRRAFLCGERLRIRHTFTHSHDSDRYAFSWNGAVDEYDLTIDVCDHQAADGRFFHGDRQRLSRRQHAIVLQEAGSTGVR